MPVAAITHTTAQLTLSDAITELELLLPDLTAELAAGRPGAVPEAHPELMLADYKEETSQLVRESVEPGFEPGLEAGLSPVFEAPPEEEEVVEEEGEEEEEMEEEDDLGLDVGPQEGRVPRPTRAATAARARSVGVMSDTLEYSPEVGRREYPERDFGDDFMSDLMDIDIEQGRKPELEPSFGLEEEMGLPGMEEDLTLLGPPSETGRAFPASPLHIEVPEAPSIHDVPQFARDSTESPLSSARSSVVRDLEADIAQHGGFLDLGYVDDTLRMPSEEREEEEEAHVQRRQVRGRRVMVDSVTEIRAKQIKAQQEDRSKILIEPSFLPRDPGLLALLSLQKTRGFVQNVFYPKNIAPELANLLSPMFVKRMADLKRKREAEEGAGEEAVERAEGESPRKMPRLEIEEIEEEFIPLPEEEAEVTREQEEEIIELAHREPTPPMAIEEEEISGVVPGIFFP